MGSEMCIRDSHHCLLVGRDTLQAYLDLIGIFSQRLPTTSERYPLQPPVHLFSWIQSRYLYRERTSRHVVPVRMKGSYLHQFPSVEIIIADNYSTNDTRSVDFSYINDPLLLRCHCSTDTTKFLADYWLTKSSP